MTTKNGLPKAGSKPLAAAAGIPAAENGGTEPDMQTTKANGLLDQSNNALIGQDIQSHLGRKLKASYEDLVRQPVPDKFRQLLEELERREKKK